MLIEHDGTKNETIILIINDFCVKQSQFPAFQYLFAVSSDSQNRARVEAKVGIRVLRAGVRVRETDVRVATTVIPSTRKSLRKYTTF